MCKSSTPMRDTYDAFSRIEHIHACFDAVSALMEKGMVLNKDDRDNVSMLMYILTQEQKQAIKCLEKSIKQPKPVGA